MKEAKCSQLGKLFVYIVPAAKLLLLPVVLTNAAGRDSYLAVAFMYLLDIAMLTLLLFTLRNIGNVTLSDFLGKFSNWVRFPILLLFCAQFLLKAAIPLVEEKLFLEDSFYQKISMFAFYLPVCLVLLYISVKSARTYGRIGELLFVLSIISFALIFVLALDSFDPKELLPFLFDGIGPIAKGCFQVVFWFGDFLLMVHFFGRISDPENAFKKILVYAFVCMALTVFFMILFTGIFGAVAVKQIFALSKISKYNLVLSEVGRFDWFAVLILLGGILFGAAVNLGAAVQLFQDAFGIKKKTWIAVAMTAILLAAGLLFNNSFNALFDLFSGPLIWFFLFMQYLMPVVLFVLSFFFRRSYERILK